MNSFEANSSWCYNFARYVAIPLILEMPEVTSGQGFLLRELTGKILKEKITDEQQEMIWKGPNGAISKVKWSVKFYVAFLLPKITECVALGKGRYRKVLAGENPILPDQELEEIEAEAVDEADFETLDPDEDLKGWVYAFSFPMIFKEFVPSPIKIGKCLGDVDSRVKFQCRKSAIFEDPKIIGKWQVEIMSHTESAIHYVLKVRGKWREDAPGKEWFNTTLQEIEQIINFLTLKE